MATENWVTINGVHVLIGASGKITKGPAKFIGSTVADMKNVGGNNSKSNSKDSSSKSNKSSDNNPMGMSRKARGEAIRNIKKNYDGASNSKINEDLEYHRKVMGSSTVGSKTYNNSRLHVLALSDMKNSRSMGSMTTEDKASIMGSNTLVHSGNPSKGLLVNPAKITNSRQQQRFNETINDIANRNSTGASKYPSGITTTAQKRAYTRAINSGKSSSEAKKIAENSGKGLS